MSRKLQKSNNKNDNKQYIHNKYISSTVFVNVSSYFIWSKIKQTNVNPSALLTLQKKQLLADTLELGPGSVKKLRPSWSFS